MTETLTDAPRAKLRRRRVARERLGRDLREAQPVAAEPGDRRLRGLGRGRRARGRGRRGRGVPGLVRGCPPAQRAAFFFKAADALEARTEQIAQDMTAEMGKPLREARGEAARTAAILRFSGGEAYRSVGEVYEPSVPNQRLYTVRRPIGVVGLITPWNFPAAIPVWKLAPALIYGNTVVLKLGYEAPRTGLHIAECFAEAGLPAGVLNVLTGARLEGRRRARLEPGRPRDLVHRLGRGRPLGARGGDGPQLPRPARARRAQPDDRARRRRARPRGRGGVRGRVLVGRPEVHRDPADLRAGRRLRRLPHAAARPDRVGQGRRPVRPRDGGRARSSTRARSRTSSRRSSAAGPRAAPSSRAASAPTTRPTWSRRPCSRASPTRRTSPARRCSARSPRSTASRRSTRRSRARTRSSSASRRRSSRATSHAVQRFTSELQAGILHVNSQTAGADVHVPFGGIKGSGWGPHEQGRAALEFYSELVTVYQDAPLDLSSCPISRHVPTRPRWAARRSATAVAATASALERVLASSPRDSPVPHPRRAWSIPE